MFTSRRIATMGGDKFRDEFSLAFDGTDDYIELGTQAGDLRLSGSNGSIFAWVKPELTGDDYQRVVDKSDEANAANGYAIIIHDDGQLRGAMDGATRVYSSTGALKANEWAHVGYSWNGSMHYVWINGELAASASDTTMPPSDTTNMRIGSWNHAAAREFKGKISEVAIYSTAFSSGNVSRVYNGREPYNHREGIFRWALEGWWRMGDGKFDGDNRVAGVTVAHNSDATRLSISNEAVIPTLSNELYDASNALANMNNANNITGLNVQEAGSAGSGTDQIAVGGSGGRYSVHIDASVDGDRVAEDLNDFCTVGKTYRLSCIAKHGGSGDHAGLRMSSALTLSSDVTTIESLDDYESNWAYYGVDFVHTANTRYFGIRELGSQNQEFYIERLSIREYNIGTGVMTNMSVDDLEGDTP